MVGYKDILAVLDTGMKAFNDANPVTIQAPDGTFLYNNEPMDVAWDNTRYDPVAGKPFQEISLLPATPRQPAQGAGAFTYDTGIYQIALYYPQDEGLGNAAGRADLLRNYFKRGALLTYNGVTVSVERTPSISRAPDPAWLKIVVSVPYFIYS